MRTLATLAIGALPGMKLKNRLLCLINRSWRMGHGSSISCVLLWRVEEVRLEPGSRIGFGTVLRDLRSIELGTGAVIGQWNWITAAPPLRALSLQAGRLFMGAHSALTSRHYVDCSGGVHVGSFSTIAGVRSTVITHGIDVISNCQRVSPIVVGDYALIGSNVALVPGATIPSRSVVAMGSTVVKGLAREQALYAGAPAIFKRSLVNGQYFQRSTGYVAPAGEVEPARE